MSLSIESGSPSKPMDQRREKIRWALCIEYSPYYFNKSRFEEKQWHYEDDKLLEGDRSLDPYHDYTHFTRKKWTRIWSAVDCSRSSYLDDHKMSAVSFIDCGQTCHEIGGLLTFDEVKKVVNSSHARASPWACSSKQSSLRSSNQSSHAPIYPWVFLPGKSSLTGSNDSSLASFSTARSVSSSLASFDSCRSSLSDLWNFKEMPKQQEMVLNRSWNDPLCLPGMTAVSETTESSGDSLSAPKSEFRLLLEEKALLLSRKEELNWSGKGQHVEFKSGEDIPLSIVSHLGSSMTATVDKVRCRRIFLARKKMRCTYKWKLSDALVEVEHLNRLKHRHIVQLVGTYLQGRHFAILMYPAADCHLRTFLEDMTDMRSKPFLTDKVSELTSRKGFLKRSLLCLANALRFVHKNSTKHMDIKPANILVKRRFGDPFNFNIYLADFGLSRSFASEDYSQTEGPTARTPRYCAPEVYDFDRRGRSADIFSLGCVYVEILTVMEGFSLEDFADFRSQDDHDDSFHCNLDRVSDWISQRLPNYSRFTYPSERSLRILQQMLLHDPSKRPNADEVVRTFQDDSDFFFDNVDRECCTSGPEPYKIERRWYLAER